ncbi:uncharacterized protein N7496_000362 [Penicillium cataractarum]|uniref:Uncharacterized protein n=1 Tax=Penicillium cataractarum TaxID=2100454 RepID=A0A9W9VUC8_9EURO|nr:uncharacterized protein N7496_000362 [Penicillium cataractarum]KAJ5389294.1 hypothetical protein N7496_000362 [Penicillium cataractarum]
MTDDQIQPRRRRRSSISERIQRALHVDRSDKKRQSFSPENDSNGVRAGQSAPSTAQAQLGEGARINKTDAAIGHHTPTGYSFQDETLPSTQTYSSQDSRLPSTCTPGSSPSVRPAQIQDEQSMHRYMATPDMKKSKDKNDICSSPTWKETARKERRATKRLEAERKELEKRLIQLEESQARLEHGIYDRQSRRLTKKQPLDSGKRSSSANSERPRSSRSLTAFFSGSRRSSRSRASSANGNDRRRSSDNENPEGGPPTLPLSLTERFGTAVSRELASRHGTSLIPNHQLQRSSHLLHHTAAKSDDLRENWKMAEAWQKQNSEREAGDYLNGFKTEMGVNAGAGGGAAAQSVSEPLQKKDNPLVYPSYTNSPIDLDRELFTASLRQERKRSETQKPATPSALRPGGLSVAQGQNYSQTAESPTTRVATARQLHKIAHGEDKRSSPKKLRSSSSIPKDLRNGTDHNSHAHQKEYKSSPLALNPVTTDENDLQKENMKPPKASAAEQNSRGLVPQPLRINFEFSRGRNRQASYPSSSDATQTRAKQNARQDQRATLMGPVEIPAGNIKHNQRRWNPTPIAFDKPQPTAWELRPPPSVIPPLKHPGRKYALSDNSPYGRLSHDGQQIPAIITTEAVPVTRSQESVPHIRHSLAEIPASQSTPNVLVGRGHSRSSSGASSYDTADEEVLDTPNHPSHRKTHPPTLETQETNNSSATTTTITLPNSPITNEIQTINLNPNPNATQINPPLSPDGTISLIRRNPLQKPKALKKDQLLAKLFVICCHCQYWHDLPSEIYAKLACPERIPPESYLVRNFSRRNSIGRRTSFKAVFGGRAPERRLMGKQGSASNEMQLVNASTAASGAAGQTEIESAAAKSVSLACCWCGHGMNRACCQGWTTLVQMRERHH